MKPGEVLLSKYRVERELGSGGMGVVVLTTHLQLGTKVVVKSLRPEHLHDTVVVKRFLREAQAAARLRSEHVCRVFDVGELADGAPYMAMEFMEGVDLRELTRTRGQLPRGRVVDYVLQACEALAEAHVAGIVHRDLKPGNLFVATQPDGTSTIKVLDFGISKVQSPADEDITLDRSVLGTPAYMAPEQMRSARDADPRSDIWSLGIVLFELLTGARPFSSKLFTELCLMVSLEPTPPMDPSIPEGLQAVIQRCLCKDPGDRYQNVAEFAAELAEFAADSNRATAVVQRTGRFLGMASGLIAIGPAQLNPGAIDGASTGGDQRSPTTLSGSIGEVNVRPAHARGAVWVITAALIGLIGLVVAVALNGADTSSLADEDPAEQSSSASAAPPPIDAGPQPDAGRTGTTPHSKEKKQKPNKKRRQLLRKSRRGRPSSRNGGRKPTKRSPTKGSGARNKSPEIYGY